MGGSIDGDWRGGYWSQTSHSSSHNTDDHGIVLYLSVDYRLFDDSIHDNVRGDSRGEDRKHVSSSKYIRHSYLHNDGESIDGDERSGYRSQTRPSPSHHSGEIGRLLDFYICGHERSGHRYQTRQFSLYNHSGI